VVGCPAFESLGIDRLDGDRHEGVVHAADLVALAVIDAGLVDAEPDFVQTARHRVFLHAEGRHEPGVDHVRARDHDAHRGPHRHDGAVVDLEKARLARLQVGVGHHVAVELERTVVRILVAPVPLVARHLQREVGVGRLVGEIDEAEGRDRDHDEDQHRHNRPGDLKHRVMRGLGRCGVGRGAETHDRVEQQRQNENRDQRDDHKQHVVERADEFFDRRGGRLHAELPGQRLARFGRKCQQQKRQKKKSGARSDRSGREHGLPIVSDECRIDVFLRSGRKAPANRTPHEPGSTYTT